jgi:hypothetical protein
LDSAVSAQGVRSLEAALRPFLDQQVALGAIIAVGCEWLWTGDHGNRDAGAPHPSQNETTFLRLAARRDRSFAILEQIPMTPPTQAGDAGDALAGLARRARELAAGAPGDPLLLLSADALDKMMVPSCGDFGFRAVAILPSPDFAGSGWKLQRSLFDHGLIGIGVIPVPGGEARCYLASDAVSSLRGLGAGSRGTVTMTRLGNHGRFANQLFQYAFLKMYTLRHGATVAVPSWGGKHLYGFDDPSCDGLWFPQLRFPGHVLAPELWEAEEPPIGVDMLGYFQEIPACWRRHRPFLRRMFQLPRPFESAIDAWHADMTRGGERTLVAIHVRRGDYRDQSDNPWLRLVPEAWYLAWLRTIWPTLRDPLLFIATDEPDVIRPVFKEFETAPASLRQAVQLLPDSLRDFEILRRADYLAMCNSSFSRMAAILAHPAQKCFLPAFHTKRFVPYEPWLDPDFWGRFAV